VACETIGWVGLPVRFLRFFFKIQKTTFYVFLSCLTRILQHCYGITDTVEDNIARKNMKSAVNNSEHQQKAHSQNKRLKTSVHKWSQRNTKIVPDICVYGLK